MKIFKEIHQLIVNCRRKIDVENSYKRFDNLVKNNIDIILKEFDTRWLISICDTYADYGTPLESSNALQISLFINFDRLLGTMLSVVNDSNINDSKLKNIGNYRLKEYYWDGLTYFHLLEGDTIINFVKRMDYCISETPILYRIFKEIINRIKLNEKSTINYMNRINKNNKFL